MHSSSVVQRVIMVVLDGLRADAIDTFCLPHLERLAREGAATFAAHTVAPSVTAAVMTSLFTGVPPEQHGIRGDQFGIPRRVHKLHPFPRLLAAANYPSAAFLAEVPRLYGWLARQIARGRPAA